MKTSTIVRVLAAALVVLFAASCVSFREESSLREAEITAFGDVYLDVVSVSDLKNLGQVTAKRTVNYTLQENGDYTVQMDGYTFTWNAAESEAAETGTRVVGNLNFAKAPTAGGALDLGGGFLSGLNPFASDSSAPESASARNRSARDIALDAVNFDLLQEAARKGAMAILLPDYSWEVEEVVSGTDMNIPILGPSRTIKTVEVTYTVTARATAVSF